MASRIAQLQEQRSEKMRAMAHILDSNQGSWRDKPDLTKQYDAGIAEINDLDEQIARERRSLELAGDKHIASLGIREIAVPGAADVANVNAAAAVDPFNPVSAKLQREIFRAWAREGSAGIGSDLLDQARSLGIRNTMSTTTGSQGGYTVPNVIAAQLIDAMKAYGAMRKCADVFSTADGRPLNYPTSDGTAELGELIAQNVTATGADLSFNTVALNVYKYSSRIVAVPFELLQDAIVDIEALVNKRLAQRLGRIGNSHFTIGNGTTQPNGVTVGATVGKTGANGQTLTIIYDDLIDLIHSIDPAYRTPACAWQTSDALIKVIRKLKDSNNRPLWMPNWDTALMQGIGLDGGSAGNSIGTGQASIKVYDTLLGYPLYVNNDMPVPAANAVSLAFGDWSFYKIRDSMDVQMFRFTDSAYTQLGQVGFLAWCRMGGNIVDLNAIKTYKHSAT